MLRYRTTTTERPKEQTMTAEEESVISFVSSSEASLEEEAEESTEERSPPGEKKDDSDSSSPALAHKETVAVNRSKLLVYAVLLLTAAVAAGGTYMFVRRGEENDFEQQVSLLDNIILFPTSLYQELTTALSLDSSTTTPKRLSEGPRKTPKASLGTRSRFQMPLPLMLWRPTQLGRLSHFPTLKSQPPHPLRRARGPNWYFSPPKLPVRIGRPLNSTPTPIRTGSSGIWKTED